MSRPKDQMQSPRLDLKHVDENLRQYNLRRAAQKKIDDQQAQQNANQAQQGPNISAPAAQPEMSHDELMNKLRYKGIKAFGDRASRSWDQGAYDPQSAFWIQFWDFLFNGITEVLLRAGYLDPQKIAAGLVDDVKEQAQHGRTPRDLPPGSPAMIPHPKM
jgi:hypothetical protein